MNPIVREAKVPTLVTPYPYLKAKIKGYVVKGQEAADNTSSMSK